MNILVSYNWLKEYLKTDLSPEDFASRVSLCGPGVERIYPQGEMFEKIVIGKIMRIKPHPNADKLKIVETDIKDKVLEIVCGGSNLKEGMKVAVALSGAKIRWHGEGELIELKPAEIRGVKSEGMICAATEIGLEWQFSTKDEREILNLSELDAAPGTLLSDALDMKDVVFDIEVTTNRPDAFSILGIGREAGTILRAPFKMPKAKSIKGKKGDLLSIENKEPDLCYRYQAVVLDGVKVKESPWWLKRKLMTAGTRSINNIVDITNLILWEMGQPLHAFDYDKLEDSKIIIRRAKEGEKIQALDGEEYELKNNHLVIADGKNASAVAGIMGGELSGVTENTKRIVLEAATFDPVSVRKTSRQLNLRSESSNLFEKGLSTEATEYALARAVELIQELAGGQIVSEVFDVRSRDFEPKEITLDIVRANKIIGVELKGEEMVDILTRLGFSCALCGNSIKAKAPFWREGDIEAEEDLIEEVARIYGYGNLPSILPTGSIPDEPRDMSFEWEKKIKELCVASGFCEVLPYSFISKELLERFDIRGAIKVANPLSVDLEFMRPSLLPGLMQIVSENEKNFEEGRIFELSRTYHKTSGLPEEKMNFSGMLYGVSEKGEVFYKIKGFIEEMLERFGAEYSFKECGDKNYHPARRLDVFLGKEQVGSFGEAHPSLAQKFGLSSQAGMFDFDFKKLTERLRSHKAYTSLSAYPPIMRDLAFIIDVKTEYRELEEAIYAVHELIREIVPFDVYEGTGVPEGKKSIALHITFRSSHKTLEAKEVDKIWDKIAEVLKEDFDAKIRM